MIMAPLDVGWQGEYPSDVRHVTAPPEMHHDHQNVQGGWLRPAVFGAMDGLVSNFALIAGVAGGGAPRTQSRSPV